MNLKVIENKVKQAIGNRPSRVELFENMDFETYLEIKKNSKENIFKDYIGYLMSIDELDCTEKEEIDGFCWKFIKMIENTRMSKSYKMPFLLAFYNNGDLKSSIDDEDLYKSFKEFYSIKENMVDMYADKNTSEFTKRNREQYVELARSNPVKYMLKSESEFFELDKGKIVVKRLEEFKGNKFFVDNIRDVIEFRTKEYYKTRYDNEVKKMSCIFVHLMPRYIGDTKYPKGGVRGVIPEKMSY